MPITYVNYSVNSPDDDDGGGGDVGITIVGGWSWIEVG